MLESILGYTFFLSLAACCLLTLGYMAVALYDTITLRVKVRVHATLALAIVCSTFLMVMSGVIGAILGIDVASPETWTLTDD